MLFWGGWGGRRTVGGAEELTCGVLCACAGDWDKRFGIHVQLILTTCNPSIR